jgi:hypothetical protein
MHLEVIITDITSEDKRGYMILIVRYLHETRKIFIKTLMDNSKVLYRHIILTSRF